MFAIIEVGAKQFKVKKGDIIEVEKQEVEEGTEMAIKNVLLTVKDDDVQVGRPYVKNAVVNAKILKQIKAEKVLSFKYRRRKSSHWTKGHRQKLTRLQISDIVA